jgi:leucyl/phenylalanyl-tRNA---protein transferase
MPVALLAENDYSFPDPSRAESQPNGLLAIGGDLSVPRLITAYAHGIFPWFDSDDQPVLWWSPDPRAVLHLDRFKISRSLRRRLARGEFELRFDTAFAAVIERCARSGDRRHATWITDGMLEAYLELYRQGYAHSVEAWRGSVLAGGLYGLSLGRMFFGESMFSECTDASKAALAALVARLKQWDFTLIDCQVLNPHLASLGAEPMPRARFVELLRENRRCATRRGHWTSCDDTAAE